MNERYTGDDPVQQHIDAVLRVPMPVGPQVAFLAACVKRWFKPTVVGLERLPRSPALFVGNHALLALDGAVFWTLMNYDYGRFLRPLADRTLFANPQYAALTQSMGAAMGRPEVCAALMAAGHDILLFPGGTYEAVKVPEQRYELLWQQRYGFIRVAAKMGYTIMPFAAVGPEEYYEHHLEGHEVLESRLMQTLMRLGAVPADLRADLVPPIPAGVFGSPLPKPKSTFIGFGRPVDLSEFAGKDITRRQQVRLRDRVAAEIETQVKALLLLREQRRHRDGLLRRILSL